MLVLLLACADDLVHAEPTCDPRLLEPGEVRARPITCNDDAPEDGDGRPGDWLIENALARYVVRGTYAALTTFEEGGTLIDAERVDGADLLVEYLPDGDRSSVEAVSGDGWAELVLPGFTWHLDADDPTLHLDGSPGGWLRGRVDATRTGTTLREGATFLGFDGALTAGGSTSRIEGVTRVTVDPAGLFDTPVAGAADADVVVVHTAEGVEVDRLPVVDGVYEGTVPAGATLRGERPGCVYEALVPVSCGALHLRLQDGEGNDLDGTLTDGVTRWYVPPGGGVLPVGPTPRTLHLWSGPTHAVTTLWYPGGDATAEVALRPAFDPGDWVLADLAAEVAPDADTEARPRDVLRAGLGDGVAFSVLVADDAIPVGSRYAEDHVLGVDASRAAGAVWSWPWDANTKRPASGIVPAEGLSPLDLLAVSEGGDSAHRLTVVTRAWVEAARAEADPSLWTEHPDVVWLAGPEDVDTYLGLLDRYEDVRPGGPSTWVQVRGALNVPAVEAALVDGRVSAGNGPLVALSGSRRLAPGEWELRVRVSAPPWMGVTQVTLVTDQGEETVDLVDGAALFVRAPEVRWAVATVRGGVREPWLPQAAWAVSQPVWLARP